MQFLLGDYDWVPHLVAQTQKPLIQSLLDDENALSHGYRQALANRPGLIRTPTREINQSFLSPLKMEDRVEAACNIAVSAARQALRVLGLDSVLCGVVGPLAGEPPWSKADVSRFLGEEAIFLIDKEVDCLQLEGVGDLKSFQQVLEMIKMVNLAPVPLSAFLDLRQKPTDQLWVDLLTLANGLELELVGMELTLEQALDLPPPPGLGGWGRGRFYAQTRGEKLKPRRRRPSLKPFGCDGPKLNLGRARNARSPLAAVNPSDAGIAGRLNALGPLKEKPDGTDIKGVVVVFVGDKGGLGAVVIVIVVAVVVFELVESFFFSVQFRVELGPASNDILNHRFPAHPFSIIAAIGKVFDLDGTVHNLLNLFPGEPAD